MWDVFSPVGEMYYILSSFRGNGSGVNKPNKLLSSQALSLYVCVCVLVCLFCMSLSLCACVRGPEVSSLSLFSLVLRYGLSGNLQLILSSLTDQQAPQILLSVCLSVCHNPNSPGLGLQVHATTPNFYMVAREPNSGPHVSAASTLSLSHLPRSRVKHHFFKGLWLPCTEREKYSVLGHWMTLAGVL